MIKRKYQISTKNKESIRLQGKFVQIGFITKAIQTYVQSIRLKHNSVAYWSNSDYNTSGGTSWIANSKSHIIHVYFGISHDLGSSGYRGGRNRRSVRNKLLTLQWI